MKCDLCNNMASVYLTQHVNGQMTNVNLCESCSKEKGVTDTTGFGLADAFIGPAVVKQDELACAACGFTQSQLKKIGRMGCPECYKTFRSGLDGLLSAMHKGTRHVGKQPGYLPQELPILPQSHAVLPAHQQASPAEILAELEVLKRSLQESVAAERFEDAARIKKEIVLLEASLAELESA